MDRPRPAPATLCALIVVVTAAGGLAFRTGVLRHLAVQTLTWPVNVLPGLALAAVALEGRRRRVGPLISREWVLLALFLSGVTYLLTLAPTLKIAERPWGTAPFRWLYLYLPGAAAFRAPGRWSLAFALMLALLVALGASALADRLPRWRHGALGALLALMLLELNVFPLPWTRIPPIPPIYPWLAARPGEFAVVELPMAEGGVDAWAMFWGASTHWPTLVNGGGGFLLATTSEIVSAIRPALDPEALGQALRRIVPLRYVVVHRDPSRLAERLRTAQVPGLRPLGTVGPDDVYELTPVPDTGIDLRRDFGTVFVRAHPTAELTLRLDGVDPDVTRWVEARLNGRALGRIDPAGPTTLRMAPPFRAADRNELRLRHQYQVRPEVVRATESYRIGTTGARAPVDIEVVSEGRGPQGQGGQASVIVNGHEALALPRRGYNLVALDGGDGHPMWADYFDTFRAPSESQRLAQRIASLPAGTIVVVAVKTDGGGQLTAEGVSALQSVGAQRDLRHTLWLAHALVGVKGAPPGSALEASGPGRVTASLGRPRPLTFTLEGFALR
jgi:hypothetical protein